MKKQILFAVLVLAFLFAFFPSKISAQSVTGTILGTVSDSKGGAVAGAIVTITNADQNIAVRTLTTDQQGQYVAALLPVGRYAVTAESSGFKKVVHSGLVLNVDDKLAVNLTLEVGAVNESVTVARCIGGEHANLAVRDLPRRTRILPCHAT